MVRIYAKKGKDFGKVLERLGYVHRNNRKRSSRKGWITGRSNEYDDGFNLWPGKKYFNWGDDIPEKPSRANYVWPDDRKEILKTLDPNRCMSLEIKITPL